MDGQIEKNKAEGVQEMEKWACGGGREKVNEIRGIRKSRENIETDE